MKIIYLFVSYQSHTDFLKMLIWVWCGGGYIFFSYSGIYKTENQENIFGCKTNLFGTGIKTAYCNQMGESLILRPWEFKQHHDKMTKLHVQLEWPAVIARPYLSWRGGREVNPQLPVPCSPVLWLPFEEQC